MQHELEMFHNGVVLYIRAQNQLTNIRFIHIILSPNNGMAFQLLRY
jgi:hypothetical protein